MRRPTKGDKLSPPELLPQRNRQGVHRSHSCDTVRHPAEHPGRRSQHVAHAFLRVAHLQSHLQHIKRRRQRRGNPSRQTTARRVESHAELILAARVACGCAELELLVKDKAQRTQRRVHQERPGKPPVEAHRPVQGNHPPGRRHHAGVLLLREDLLTLLQDVPRHPHAQRQRVRRHPGQKRRRNRAVPAFLEGQQRDLVGAEVQPVSDGAQHRYAAEAAVQALEGILAQPRDFTGLQRVKGVRRRRSDKPGKATKTRHHHYHLHSPLPAGLASSLPLSFFSTLGYAPLQREGKGVVRRRALRTKEKRQVLANALKKGEEKGSYFWCCVVGYLGRDCLHGGGCGELGGKREAALRRCAGCGALHAQAAQRRQQHLRLLRVLRQVGERQPGDVSLDGEEDAVARRVVAVGGRLLLLRVGGVAHDVVDGDLLVDGARRRRRPRQVLLRRQRAVCVDHGGGQPRQPPRQRGILVCVVRRRVHTQVVHKFVKEYTAAKEL
eukprot:Rhum_TRINITY_DN14699_c2_g1::Rhum_TRINITY_DN14699_c2_g1_i1::g.108408::m.108408